MPSRQWIQFENGMTVEEFKNHLKNNDLQSIPTVTSQDMPVKFLDKETNDELWEKISVSSPSDHVCLEDKDTAALRKLWQPDKDSVRATPSDLFFAETIPLMDFKLSVTERTPRNGKPLKCNFRIVIYPDYAEKIKKAKDTDSVDVGALVTEVPQGQLISTFLVAKGIDSVMPGWQIGYHNMTHSGISYVQQRTTQNTLFETVTSVLEIWYGIQIALLHPLVQDVFAHPSDEIVYDYSGKNGKKKRVTKYVKKHVIKSEDIKRDLNSHGYDRKTLVWYVIGHWRVYQDGRKVFVHPYWKGPMRNLKKNVDDGRERIIVT